MMTAQVIAFALATGLVTGCAGAGEGSVSCLNHDAVDPVQAERLCDAVRDLAPNDASFIVEVVAATPTAIEANLIRQADDATPRSVVGPLRLSQKDANLDDRAFTQLAAALLRESTR